MPQQTPPPAPPQPPSVEHTGLTGSDGVRCARDSSSGVRGVEPLPGGVAAGTRGESPPEGRGAVSNKDRGKGDRETRGGRYRHPAGQVLATSVREYLALPAGGVVGVKFEGLLEKVKGVAVGAEVCGGGVAAKAQGFLELHKM